VGESSSLPFQSSVIFLHRQISPLQLLQQLAAILCLPSDQPARPVAVLDPFSPRGFVLNPPSDLEIQLSKVATVKLLWFYQLIDMFQSCPEVLLSEVYSTVSFHNV
jgi:hypothetical protein